MPFQGDDDGRGLRRLGTGARLKIPVHRAGTVVSDTGPHGLIEFVEGESSAALKMVAIDEGTAVPVGFHRFMRLSNHRSGLHGPMRMASARTQISATRHLDCQKSIIRRWTAIGIFCAHAPNCAEYRPANRAGKPLEGFRLRHGTCDDSSITPLTGQGLSLIHI